MGLFNRKKGKNMPLEKAVSKCVEILRQVDTEDNGTGIFFVAGDGGGGSTYIVGDAPKIGKLIESSCKQHTGLKNVIETAMERLVYEGDPRDMPSGLKDFIKKLKDQKDKSEVVDMPGGGRGIAIDLNNIDNMSDAEIDSIIDKMLKENERNKGGANPSEE